MLAATPSFWKTLRTLSSSFNLSQQKSSVYSICFLVVASKLCITLAPLVFKTAVHAVEQDAISQAMAWVVLYGFFRLLSAWLFEIKDMLFVPMEQKALARISLRVFKHLQYTPLSFHVNRKTAELLRMVEQGTKGIEDFSRFFIFYMAPLVLEIFLVCLFLWSIYPAFFGFILLGTFFCYAIFTLILSHIRLKWLREMNVLDHKASTKSLDTLQSYAAVKYFHQEEEETKRYKKFFDAYQNVGKKMRYSLMALNMGQSLILSLGLIFILIKCLQASQAGTMHIGDFALVNLYVLQFLLPLHGLGFIYRELTQAWFYLRKMFSLLEVAQEKDDETAAKVLTWKGGHIQFHDVSFSYLSDRPLLQKCSFSMDPGKTVALVGSSGTGKTTISSLLVRFFDVESGFISLDGTDIRQVTRQSLREVLGVVPQDTILFDESIAYNLRYGKPSATLEEIQDAAQKAGIHQLIMRLPHGYDTLVGERGAKLSGGERQRLAIARVLLRDPKIFVFDEATAHLDAITEKEIQDNIRNITKNRTTLIISHRLSIIQDAHLILVLHEGAIVEQGTHDELLARNGLYTSLWLKQHFHGAKDVVGQETP